MHKHSRRGFLRTTLGACWTGASLLEQSVFRAAQARAQSNPGLPSLFDIHKVADGVYAAIARPAALVNCNAAIFENANDLLIVDTHSKSSAVVTLVSQIRREISNKPVRYIVNSHFHWDHSQGNPAYRRIAPHADMVASEATRRLLSENGVQRLKQSLEQAQKSLELHKQSASKATSDELRKYYLSMAEETRQYISEMKNYAPELPNVTFERDLIIHDKAHDLHLAFRGRGHTSGDIVVYCPQKRVIATGDLLHGFAPYIGDGYPLSWNNTLLAAAFFDFTHVIGGHGDVQDSRERLYQMGTYIEELAMIVQRGKREGKSLAQIQDSTTPDTLLSLGEGYGRFFSGQLLKHTPNPPGTTADQLLASAIRANLEQVFNRLDNS